MCRPMRSRLLLAVLAFSLLPLVSSLAQPANNLFANAWLLSGMSVATNGNSALPSNANKEAGEPNHAGFPGGRSVWFLWTAPSNGIFRVATAGSAFNTLLAVYTGSTVSTLTSVGANDDAGGAGTTSRVDFP